MRVAGKCVFDEVGEIELRRFMACGLQFILIVQPSLHYMELRFQILVGALKSVVYVEWVARIALSMCSLVAWMASSKSLGVGFGGFSGIWRSQNESTNDSFHSI